MSNDAKEVTFICSECQVSSTFLFDPLKPVTERVALCSNCGQESNFITPFDTSLIRGKPNITPSVHETT
ncbi:MAG: hypothetical protein WAV41_03525 [Microgenomates group bacterium]